MKKKVVTAAMVAALVLAQSTAAFAARSTSTGPMMIDEVSITGSGITTPSYGGQATIGDTSVSFVKGSSHAVAGLPTGIVETISAINRNKTELAKAGTGIDLSGYNALVGTYAVMTYKAGTTIEKTGNVTMSVYVPNLTAGLGDVEVLFYNNMTGRWPLLKPSAPLVGTGIEHRIAVDSGEVIVAQNAGVVDYVDGQTIIIEREDGEYD